MLKHADGNKMKENVEHGNYNGKEHETSSKQSEKLAVGGFLFRNHEDAELARLEGKKIEQLEHRMKYEDSSQVKAVFDKAISTRVFQTPAGLAYLRELQQYLKQAEDLDGAIQNIPVYQNYTQFNKTKETYLNFEIRPSDKMKNQLQRKYNKTKITIGILIAMILLMFLITLTGDNPNILNYENALINKYAKWEQELSERELNVKKRELELNLESE